MMKWFFLGLFVSMQASALIELRAHIGASTTSNNFNDALQDELESIAPSLPGMTPIGADVVVNLPLIPLGFGLRYETFAFNTSANGVEFDVSTSNVSILLNKRFIDLFAYFGVIATYSISNTTSSKIRVTQAIQTVQAGSYDLMTGTPTVYQVGLEGGVKLIGWVVGGELGYQSQKYSDVDLSGTYMKVIAGFGF